MCRFEFKVRAEIGRCMGKQKALAEHIVAEANKIGKVKSAVDTAVKNLKGAMPWTDWAVMGFTGWLQKRFTILILMSMHDRHLCLVLTTLHI